MAILGSNEQIVSDGRIIKLVTLAAISMNDPISMFLLVPARMGAGQKTFDQLRTSCFISLSLCSQMTNLNI